MNSEAKNKKEIKNAKKIKNQKRKQNEKKCTREDVEQEHASTRAREHECQSSIMVSYGLRWDGETTYQVLNLYEQCDDREHVQ